MHNTMQNAHALPRDTFWPQCISQNGCTSTVGWISITLKKHYSLNLKDFGWSHDLFLRPSFHFDSWLCLHIALLLRAPFTRLFNSYSFWTVAELIWFTLSSCSITRGDSCACRKTLGVVPCQWIHITSLPTDKTHLLPPAFLCLDRD